jgi:hypothetical protein
MKAVYNYENEFSNFENDSEFTKEDNMTSLDVLQCKQNKQKKTQDLDSKRYNLAYLRFCNKKRNSARDIVGIDADETEVVKKLGKMWQEDFFKLKNAVDKKKRKSIAVKARYTEM